MNVCAYMYIHFNVQLGSPRLESSLNSSPIPLDIKYNHSVSKVAYAYETKLHTITAIAGGVSTTFEVCVFVYIWVCVFVCYAVSKVAYAYDVYVDVCVRVVQRTKLYMPVRPKFILLLQLKGRCLLFSTGVCVCAMCAYVCL